MDESIHLEEILSLLKNFDVELMAYQGFGIDNENQYRFYPLNYRKEKFVFEDKTFVKRSRNFPLRLLHIIGNYLSLIIVKVRIGVRKFKYRKMLKEFGNQ